MGGLSKWEILIILAYIVIQIVGWIWLVIYTVSSLVDCKNCSWRKNCESIIFSVHCSKRYCMSEEERRAVREKIKELD